MKNRSLKVIFAGTPEFAASALAAVDASNHRVVAVYTQPDRPAGRGRSVRPGAVKRYALARALPVFQPERLRDAAVLDTLRRHDADVMVVAAYGLILPPAVLSIPRLGCLNIHASLLPRWRGAAPIQRAIMAGDRQTGITIMQMDEGLDTGPMLDRAVCDIEPDDTAQTLHDRLAALGAARIVAVLDRLACGAVNAVPQEERLATYARKLSKQEAWLAWDRPAEVLCRQIRAFNPVPKARTLCSDSPVMILRARPRPEGQGGHMPGTVLVAGDGRLVVACGQGAVEILEVQVAGGRPMSTAAFLNGHAVTVGTVLTAPPPARR